MRFVLDFLLWSAIIGAALCAPLALRAIRTELARTDDPRFRPTSPLSRAIRALPSRRGREG
jgi:hypothetical protein